MGISGWKQKKEVEQGLHFRRGIKKKLLIGILVPIVVILLVFAGILEKGIGDSMREVQNSSMINQVYSAERQVKAYFDKIFTNQQMVSGMESVERTFMELDSEGSGFRFEDSVNYSRLMQDLRKVQELQGDEVQLSWIAGFANNQVLRSDGDVSDPAIFSVKDRPWYQQLQASSGTPVLTGAYADGASDKIVVSAISPVLNKQQKLVGAVGFDISLDEFQRMLKELKIGSTGFVTAYDSEGRVICHPDSSLVMKNVAEIDYSENLKSALSRHENTDILEYQYNGETLYGISHYLDEVGWVFLGSVPRTEYIKEQSNAILFISIAIIICILVLVTLCILVANKILNPIRSISRVAPNLIRGKLEMDLPEAPDDEIGALIRVFGEMAEGLEHIICDISNTLESVVSKDLTAKTTAEYNGDFVRIQTAMYRIIDGTNEIMGAVIRSAEQVSLGSEQVSAGAQGLVQGVADQAGAVEKLSISIEKMTDQIQKMSETAQQASTGAKAVGDQMQLSQEKMDEMQKAMNWIHKTSDEIEKIVKTIEDIAFQTNILALNAAVEAARAGSAGKGFAVVADEVRNLASKSAEASKNTASLIANSMEAVQHGMRLANDTGSALTTAVQGATNVVNQIRSVSNDLSAQSESMGEVALSIDEISNVVLKNSETAEESVEASEELAAQAQELKNLVADFRLKD